VLLLPHPRRLELRGDGAPLHAPVREVRVDGLGAEGYELDIASHGVELRYTGWIAALPFLCGAPFMIWWARHSDRRGDAEIP